MHKESKQRNAPQSIAPCAHPALRVRISSRVPLTAHPCAVNGICAIPRAAPAGVSDRCRRNAMGTRKSEKQRAPARRSKEIAKAPRAVAPGFDLRVPVCRGEGRSEMLAESRARCARVRCLDREVQSTNPDLTSRTRSAQRGGRGIRGCSLWLLSLAQARESDPRAGSARKTEGTR